MKIFVAPLLLLVICGWWQQLHAAKILCLVGTAKHNNPSWTQPFFEALADRGHELTVVSTVDSYDIPGLTNVYLSNDYDVMNKHYVDESGHYHRYIDLKQVLVWYEALLGSCRSLLEGNDLKENSRKRLAELNMEYDLIIYDATYSMDCLLTVLPKYRIVPILGLSGGKLTTDLQNLMQAQRTISAAGTPHFIGQLSEDMSYFQRIQNHAMYFTESFIRYAVVKPVLNGLLPSGYREPDVQLMLLNTHPVLDYVQNMPPNVIEVGGLHIRAESAPLPISVQEFVERFSEGVIYINLPFINLMYGEGIKAVETMMTEFTQFGFLLNVINLKDLQLSKSFHNLRTFNFDDKVQQDILAQSNVKAFLTHGDSFGLQEAIYNAVPVIVLPLLMDQINNAQRVEERNLGVRIQARSFSSVSFSEALKRVIREEIFSETLLQAQLEFRTRQLKPVDRAVWYAEQLVSEPQLFKNLLRPESHEQGFFVSHSLDVLVLPFIFFIMFIGNIIYMIFQSLEYKKLKKEKEKQGKKQIHCTKQLEGKRSASKEKGKAKQAAKTQKAD